MSNTNVTTNLFSINPADLDDEGFMAFVALASALARQASRRALNRAEPNGLPPVIRVEPIRNQLAPFAVPSKYPWRTMAVGECCHVEARPGECNEKMHSRIRTSVREYRKRAGIAFNVSLRKHPGGMLVKRTA